jgi:ADP-ribose pyrophosphatase YjhB (NUDIX family)
LRDNLKLLSYNGLMSRTKGPKRKGLPLGKEVSALAWIQDAYGNVLLVQQTSGRKLWSLPGGKVRLHEPIKQALRREVREEIGLTVISARVIDLFDRPVKGALAVLFQTILRRGKLKLGEAEIQAAAFVSRLPANATPSVRYFWARHFPQGVIRRNTLDL